MAIEFKRISWNDVNEGLKEILCSTFMRPPLYTAGEEIGGLFREKAVRVRMCRHADPSPEFEIITYMAMGDDGIPVYKFYPVYPEGTDPDYSLVVEGSGMVHLNLYGNRDDASIEIMAGIYTNAGSEDFYIEPMAVKVITDREVTGLIFKENMSDISGLTEQNFNMPTLMNIFVPMCTVSGSFIHYESDEDYIRENGEDVYEAEYEYDMRVVSKDTIDGFIDHFSGNINVLEPISPDRAPQRIISAF